jgi:hypothetical protein
MGPSYSYAYVARSCRCNAANALVNRHLAVAPPYTAEPLVFHRSFVAAVRAAYHDVAVYHRRDWIAKWPQSKQRAIRESEQADPDRPDRVKPTIKREVATRPLKKARLIQAYANLATQAAHAPEHTWFQNGLFRVMGKDEVTGYEYYPGIFIACASGWDAERLSQWADLVSLTPGWVYERDGKNWDATMRRPHHAAKWQLMAACDPALAEHVRRGYRCRGVFLDRGGHPLRYRADGTVKSGHNDTTSGNSAVNALICAEAMRRCGVRGYVLVLGDDLIAYVIGRRCAAALAAIERAYGIVPEYSAHESLASASFISGVWLSDGRSHRFVPMLGRLIARLWWTVHPPAPKQARAYRNGVARGLLATVAGIPCYDDYLRQFVTDDAPSQDADRYLRHRALGACDNVGFDGELAIRRRYGYDAQQLASVRCRLRRLGPTARVIDDPALHPVLERDCREDVWGLPATECAARREAQPNWPSEP